MNIYKSNLFEGGICICPGNGTCCEMNKENAERLLSQLKMALKGEGPTWFEANEKSD